MCWHGNTICIIQAGDPGVIHLEQNKLIYDNFQHVHCLWNTEISKKQNSPKTGWRADILSSPAGLPFPLPTSPYTEWKLSGEKNSEQLLWETTQTSPHLLAYSRWAHFSGGRSLSLWGPLKYTLGGAEEERGSGPRWRGTFSCQKIHWRQAKGWVIPWTPSLTRRVGFPESVSAHYG